MHRKTQNRQTSIAMLYLAGVCCCLCDWAHAVPDRFEDYGPFTMGSSGLGQLSTSVFRTQVRTEGLLQVAYVAPSSHCSAVRMHFLLDGQEKGLSQDVAPGTSSGFFDFGAVSPGEHALGLQAEGVPGGCNHGGLHAWGGRAVVRTSVRQDVTSAVGDSTLGPEVFYVSYVGFARGDTNKGLFVTSNGAVFTYYYDRNERPLAQGVGAGPQPMEADLREQFRHHQKFVTLIEPDIMRKQFEMLESLGHNPSVNHHHAPEKILYDAADVVYGAYRLDSSTGRYAKLFIAQRGNDSTTAQSPAAEPLLRWLRELERMAAHP